MKYTNIIKNQVYQYEKSIEQEVELLHNNMRGLLRLHKLMKKDTWVLICGNPGTGKSNMAVYLNRFISEFEGLPFEPKIIEQYSNLVEFLLENMDTIGNPCIIDEAAFFANSRKSMNSDNRDLNEVMDVIRVQQKRVLVAGSSLNKIDLSVRNRADVFIRTFFDIHEERYKFMFYSGARAIQISTDDKISDTFADPMAFADICKPDFISSIPKIDEQTDINYQAKKLEFQKKFLGAKMEEFKLRKLKEDAKKLKLINDAAKLGCLKQEAIDVYSTQRGKNEIEKLMAHRPKNRQ